MYCPHNCVAVRDWSILWVDNMSDAEVLRHVVSDHSSHCRWV